MRQWRTADLLTTGEVSFLTQLGLDASTLEVCCQPGHASFSIVENTSEDCRWATFDAQGRCQDHGVEASVDRARQVALEVQRLWCHRCAAARTTGCPGLCLNAPEGNIASTDELATPKLAEPGSVRSPA